MYGKGEAMNSNCDRCEVLDDYLVQHPFNDTMMVCIVCYQDAIDAMIKIPKQEEGKDEI